jgi:hypothetical protein
MKRLPLTNYSGFILVDDDIYEIFKDRKLFKTPRECICFGKDIKLHRYIMEFPKNMVVHHINNNILDNRRENLEILTQRAHQNKHNHNRYNITHQFPGAFKGGMRKDGVQIWRCRMKINGIRKSFGSFPDPISVQILRRLIDDEI